MTLDEAIEHLDEKIDNDNWSCEECKQEHIQLRAWLNELRQLTEYRSSKIVYIKNLKYRKLVPFCPQCGNEIPSYKWYQFDYCPWCGQALDWTGPAHE